MYETRHKDPHTTGLTLGQLTLPHTNRPLDFLSQTLTTSAARTEEGPIFGLTPLAHAALAQCGHCILFPLAL